MKQRWVFAALSALVFSAPAAAEPVQLAQAVEARVLPPHEILTIVRSTRLDPIGRPVRQGPNYVLHAIDEDDREMRVIVSARSGEILRMAPAATPARIPPRGGVAGPYERMDRYERAAPAPGYITPDGYRYSSRPPVIDDDDDDLPPSQRAPRPPGNVPGAAARPGSAPPPRTGYARSAAGHQGYTAGSGRGCRARHRSAAAVFRISAASVRLAGRDHSAARRGGSATTIRFAGRLCARARS